MEGCDVHQHRPRTFRVPLVRGFLAVATAGLVLLGGVAPASAEDHPGIPSQAEVDQARERVRSTERSVTAIQADLSAASERLDRLASQAESAFDEYYAAMAQLQESRATAKKAERRAERYAKRLERQRGRIASLVADTYQGGGSFGQVGAYLLADDSERLLNRISAYKGASDRMSSRFDTFAAQRAVAEVYSDQAEQAVEAAKEDAAEADAVRERAQQAVAAQQQAVAAINERRQQLLEELAAAQDISVALATERQEALERIEAERRAEERRERAAARRQAEREAEREARQRAQREARREARQEARQQARREAAQQARSDQRSSSTQRTSRRDAQAEQRAQAERAAAAARAAREAERKAAREARKAAEREARRKRRQRSRPSVVPPLPATAYYYSQSNFGNCGSLWSNCHTGNDFSASCGTPVLASNRGTVNIRTDQPWSGNWLVEVWGRDGVVTWYAHMQSVHVYDGQTVAAGQQIGSVGTLGNSTGCHLHFEVRPGGGSPIDPVSWLASRGVYV
jgi:murein DD-endopeptidase MepM/ murein hydrolase activator NlpD